MGLMIRPSFPAEWQILNQHIHLPSTLETPTNKLNSSMVVLYSFVGGINLTKKKKKKTINDMENLTIETIQTLKYMVLLLY